MCIRDRPQRRSDLESRWPGRRRARRTKAGSLPDAGLETVPGAGSGETSEMMNQEQIKQRSRRGRRRRGRGGRHGGPPGAGGGQPWQAGPPRGDDVPFGPQQRIRVTGVLELTPDGQGWLRSIATSYVPEDTDPYLPVSLTRAANLRPGSEVDGWAERLRGRLTVVDVQAVDGLTPD